MARFGSYAGFLQHACCEFGPLRALEWGPGASTRLILDAAPEVHLLSVEHHARWHKRIVKELHGHPRWEVVLVPHSTSPGKAHGYATFPLRHALAAGQPIPRFDLVFVDGRARADCLTVARMVVRPTGVVILHDAERPAYQEAMELFPHRRVDDAGSTAALFLDADRAAQFDRR